MTRTQGAKNNPPDPHQELEKVRKLFADKGLDFPGDSSQNQTKKVEDPGKEGLQIETGDETGDDDGFECGACGSDLPSQVDTCPHCGAKLTWSL